MIYIIIYTVWFISELILNRFFRSGNANNNSADKSSLKIIWITIIVSMTAGISISYSTDNPVFRSADYRLLGLGMIVLGMILRFTAVYTLGKYFTVDVNFAASQQLIQTGVYKYIRHPSYTGSLLSFAGFGLALNNWISGLIIFIPVFLSFINRIIVEERLLRAKLALPYEEYQKKTFRLVPFLY